MYIYNAYNNNKLVYVYISNFELLYIKNIPDVKLSK